MAEKPKPESAAAPLERIPFMQRLLDEIRDIMDAQQDNPSSAYGDSLSSTVRDWFVNHFKSKDARLHKKLGV